MGYNSVVSKSRGFLAEVKGVTFLSQFMSKDRSKGYFNHTIASLPHAISFERLSLDKFTDDVEFALESVRDWLFFMLFDNCCLCLGCYNISSICAV